MRYITTSRISFTLFVLGLMLTVTAAAKVPTPEQIQAGHTWPDTLPLYAAGLVTCITGLIGWRVGLRHEDATGQLSRLGPKGMMQLIINCRQAAAQIRTELDTQPNLDPDTLRNKIDSLTLTYFEPFVENRFILIEHYGMLQGAEILMQFALAERYINRTWSASADACPQEIRKSLQTALVALDDLSTRAETELQAL